MFELMGKNITTILRLSFLLNWPYVFVKVTDNFVEEILEVSLLCMGQANRIFF